MAPHVHNPNQLPAWRLANAGQCRARAGACGAVRGGAGRGVGGAGQFRSRT